MTFNGWGSADEYEITMALVDSNGSCTGTLLIHFHRTGAILGVRTGSNVVLTSMALGDTIELQGQVVGDTISGTTHYRGEIHSWQVTRAN